MYAIINGLYTGGGEKQREHIFSNAARFHTCMFLHALIEVFIRSRPEGC